MAFATYQAFRVGVQWLIEGDELTGTFSTNVLDLIIELAESRVYRDLRASSMVTALSVAVASNAATLPANLIELKEVYFSGNRPLDIVPLDRLRTLEADGSTGGGDAIYCAQDGDTLRFWPTTTGTVLGSYYAKPAALLTALNATFTRYPELFVFASLVEAMPFLGMESKVPMWDARYQRALSDAMQDEAMRVYGGGPLRMRVR